MHVLLVFDHPYGAEAFDNVPNRRSLSAAMLAAAQTGLDSAGHSSDTVDLVAEGFDPVLSADDLRAWRTGTPGRPDVQRLQDRVAAADHIVFVFPTWWMSMPAATKGFLDRVLTRGFAFEEPRPGGALVRTLHRLRGVTVLTAMTTPGPVYRAWFGRPAQRILADGTFRLIGIRRIRWIAIDRSTQRGALRRERALARITRRFAALH
ncbi:NAD(P)H-dependent oxidoreductase [Leifsonia kafniensis]|uniref:NAD(P)H-dependent oxidoreductase n=1 Tax=Leifsonia kafniensis TaxID=475957 RepID=A0ABP7K288_9MICO